MKKVRWIALSLTFATAACVSLMGQEQRSRVGQLSVVKYDELKEAILHNRGKVILVDFWGEFCPPCKANFPHVVRLHRQLAGQGLVVISVSGDDISRGNRDDVLKRVRSFLSVNGADFTNFLLDEPHQVFREKLRVQSFPCYYVFSRQGKWTQFGGGTGENIDFAVMERLIMDLLRDR
jgi:thiol-disulfide isomerase/thioredoxin